MSSKIGPYTSFINISSQNGIITQKGGLSIRICFLRGGGGGGQLGAAGGQSALTIHAN